jgi:hypothetical protein
MIFIVRTWSVASVGALFLTIGPLSGCGSGTGTSGGGGSSSPTSSTPLLGVPRLTPQSTPATVSAATSPRSAFLPDRSWAAAIEVGAWANCTVSPADARNPRPPVAIQAGRDGYLRFYAPSSAWGTKLAIDCANGGAHAAHAVDLNDTTTFARHSGTDLEPTVIRTQPALSGDDASSLSNDDLHARGYRSRPDPAQPQAYGRWLQSVSKPTTVAELVPIGDLDASFAFEGNCGAGNDGAGGWTAMVQAPAGFSDCAVAPGTKSLSQLFREYEVETFVPANIVFGSCPNCETGLWAGLGGWPYGTNPASPSLPQHGFVVEGNPGVDLMWQWAPSGPNIVGLPAHISVQDTVILEGTSVSNDACNSGFNNGAPWFCFQWIDETSGWTYFSLIQNQSTSQSVWAPVSFEMAIEIANCGGAFGCTTENAAYGYVSNGNDIDAWNVYGWAYDENGTLHSNDGNGGTDPYVNSQGPDNIGAWLTSEGTFGSPSKPTSGGWQFQWTAYGNGT